MQWEVVIGLEIHTQLATKSKIFSGASTSYGAEANTQACAVDLALPGVLPVFNEQALMMAVKFGLAIDANIGKRSVFDRKNYFYPDSPKAYQISQLYFPVVLDGKISIDLEDGSKKTIGITRAHLEEDAGKSLHEDFDGLTGIDLNRAGTPLLEIVSEPDLRSAQEAVAYMKKIHSIVRYIGISDGNMQEGSFRCDANVSIRPKGEEKLGTRTELKNINSFRFVESAINLEVERHIEILERGDKIIQETRLYDADKHETRSMRSKEEANDYRYFPDPDLLPIVISDEEIEKIRLTLPEMPEQKLQRYLTDFKLSDKDANIIAFNKDLATYFEQLQQQTNDAKISANWLLGELSAYLNKNSLDIKQCPISASDFASLLKRIKDNTISGNAAKTVFEAMCGNEGSVDEIIEQKGLKQMSDTGALEKMIDEIVNHNTKQLEQYREGKTQLLGFFVGQVMKASKGKANPAQVNKILLGKLNG